MPKTWQFSMVFDNFHLLESSLFAYRIKITMCIFFNSNYAQLEVVAILGAHASKEVNIRSHWACVFMKIDHLHVH